MGWISPKNSPISCMSVVLITGAAFGLGSALVQTFCDAGWQVIGIDIDPAVHELSKSNKSCLTFQVDVTKSDQLSGLKLELERREISVSCIVNNAGIFRFAPITEAEDLNQIFSLNALAPFQVIRTFLNDLISNKGRVIQISSENVKMSGLFQPYPSSKIALESLSTAARQELALMDVELIIIRPGAINTRLLEWQTPVTSVYGPFLDKFMKQAKDKMRTIVAPEKVAALVMKSATASNPKRMYSINHNPWLGLFSRLPYGWQEKIILRMLKR